MLRMKTVLWDVEPDTYAGRRTGEERTRFLVDYTVQNVKPGSIILIHPFCETCESGRQAISQIVDRLREKGYRFVTVTELLSSRNGNE
jgi:peptidoglycan/xylan/chitin deacetylase (PgdA/CDA1 family)